MGGTDAITDFVFDLSEEASSPSKVIVRNIAEGTTISDVQAVFGELGILREIRLTGDRGTSAELYYEDAQDAEKAMRLYDGIVADGRIISVKIAEHELVEPPREETKAEYSAGPASPSTSAPVFFTITSDVSTQTSPTSPTSDSGGHARQASTATTVSSKSSKDPTSRSSTPIPTIASTDFREREEQEKQARRARAAAAAAAAKRRNGKKANPFVSAQEKRGTNTDDSHPEPNDYASRYDTGQRSAFFQPWHCNADVSYFQGSHTGYHAEPSYFQAGPYGGGSYSYWPNQSYLQNTYQAVPYMQAEAWRLQGYYAANSGQQTNLAQVAAPSPPSFWQPPTSTSVAQKPKKPPSETGTAASSSSRKSAAASLAALAPLPTFTAFSPAVASSFATTATSPAAASTPFEPRLTPPFPSAQGKALMNDSTASARVAINEEPPKAALHPSLAPYTALFALAGISKTADLREIVQDTSSLNRFVTSLAEEFPEERLLNTFAQRFALKEKLKAALQL